MPCADWMTSVHTVELLIPFRVLLAVEITCRVKEKQQRSNMYEGVDRMKRGR